MVGNKFEKTHEAKERAENQLTFKKSAALDDDNTSLDPLNSL